MKTQKMTLSLLLTAALLAACGPKVQVPPRLDLRAYQTIGFINFESRTEGNFDAYLNDRFLEEISFAQPGADILELGPVDSVLAKVGYNTLDRDAIRELGREYGLDAIIVGTLDISNIKPHVHVLHLLRDVSVRAEVDAKIKARLIDVERGTTRWTAVARDRKNVGFLSAGAGRPFFLYAKNPDKAHGEFVDVLIFKVTRDLRASYVRR